MNNDIRRYINTVYAGSRSISLYARHNYTAMVPNSAGTMASENWFSLANCLRQAFNKVVKKYESKR